MRANSIYGRYLPCEKFILSTLAFRAKMRAALHQHNAPDSGAAANAWLSSALINAVGQLKTAFPAFRVNVI
jgi:hypothetical protein